jgi:Lipase (class 3)
MPLSITGRLLCASAHAYGVRADGAAPDALPPPVPSRSARAGYAIPPTGFASGQDLIDAGLLGLAPDGVFVVFRGTLPPGGPDVGRTVLDWASDADEPLVQGENLPGLVHQGFLNALDWLWPEMEVAIVAAAKAQPATPIYVTGHSKGGAMAPLAAVRLKALLPNATLIVRTFAAARSGDAAFAAAYNAAIPDSVRYEYADDIVPHLPPRGDFSAALKELPIVGAELGNLAAGYESVGRLQFIPSGAGQATPLQDDSPALTQARIDSLIALLRRFDFQAIIEDHNIAPGSGYASALCPGC